MSQQFPNINIDNCHRLTILTTTHIFVLRGTTHHQRPESSPGGLRALKTATIMLCLVSV